MSSKDMTLTEIKHSTKSFDDTHTVKVSGFKEPKDKIPEWFKKFHKQEFEPLVQIVIKMQTEPPKWFVDFVTERFDPFVKHVEGVFKRNNLK